MNVLLGWLIGDRVDGKLVLHFIFMFYLFIAINIVLSQRLIPATRLVTLHYIGHSAFINLFIQKHVHALKQWLRCLSLN
jgi:hypothetical protein